MQEETRARGSRLGRRTFLKSTGVLAGGWYAACGQATAQPAANKTEALALNGGPKAVTRPHGDASHWPQYGPAEEKAVIDLVRNPIYAPIDAFEKEWKSAFGYPFVKRSATAPPR